MRDATDIDGEDRAARGLDPRDDLGLYGERPDEPVKVGDDDDFGLPCLDSNTSSSSSV